MTSKHYDVIVIGSGGGTKLVTPVANLGKKVAIIEKGPLGGTCLNRGCIPSKMLIHTAQLASLIRDAVRFEIQMEGSFEIDFKHLVQCVSETIDKESESIAPYYHDHPNIDYYPYEGHFVDKEVLEAGGERLTADKIFLAVGARAAIPKIPGLEGTPYMTYQEALRNLKKPKKLIVIGGGFIATELGYFFSAIGVETEFLVRSILLRPEDDDVREAFQEAFAKQVKLRLKCDFQEVEYKDETFTVTYKDGEGKIQKAEGDALIVATGIKPWTDTLHLERTDIEVDEKGFIKVDDHLRTTQKNVWALGDCVGNYLFRHSVNFEGTYLFRTLFESPSDLPIVYKGVPHAVFSCPEIAGVGKTERELKETKVPYIVGKNSYAASARGMALLPETGFVKLLFEKHSLKLLGAHIIGEEASNMVHMLILAIQMDATLHDLLEMIYIHPALPEIVRNAARDALKQIQS
ncbi:dihydrolipoyl dehydrogenase [Candidatus Neptunochlamydia vexilliferae]|nr:dihydrolipoyl dehydrogenase [Candidatus Neptunochlamydia vexilliferae]